MDTAFSAIGITRTSTLEQVVSALRRAILDGRLAPGTPLRETALADQLGVSRGTVREALRLLGPEGLIEHRPHRGAVVAGLDPADMIDVYEARIVLESAGAERAAELGAEALRGMSDALAAMGRTSAVDDVAGYVDAHAEFHHALVELIGSDRLSRFSSSLNGELRLGFAVLDRMTGSLDDSVTAHARLLDVLASGDRNAARVAIVEHLRHGVDDVAELAP
ncbi:MAG TPA: GntR family transcriptional regulator [Acidimicrobiia bacterium]|nr:GntR family transcriptional regulator [Acidimicrobiia bacterium]